jgi:hypothetical protein
MAGCRMGVAYSWLRIRPVAAVAAAALGLLVLPPSAALAQDEPSVTTEDATPTDMSREQWRERILEAKRRARQVAIEQRGRMSYQVAPPSREEEERQASERVLNDDSLQPGDIVSTSKGLFVFKGRPDRERSDGDFVALPPR